MRSSGGRRCEPHSGAFRSKIRGHPESGGDGPEGGRGLGYLIRPEKVGGLGGKGQVGVVNQSIKR